MHLDAAQEASESFRRICRGVMYAFGRFLVEVWLFLLRFKIEQTITGSFLFIFYQTNPVSAKDSPFEL
jgi:hypothetical protein